MPETNLPTSGKRILLVDDDQEIVSIIQHIGTLVGFNIDCYASGIEAFESFCANGADVVLLDLMLSDIDGLEVARRIRSLPQGVATKLVLMSGVISNETREQAEPLGFSKILEKPVSVPDLVQILKQLTESAS